MANEFKPPQGSCDCHIHINDPRFAYVAGADLHPAPATVEDYRALQRSLGLTRVVVVQPSSYGTDNRCLVAALGELGADARGVAVVDRQVSEAELHALHRAGVRGIRFNLLRPSPVDAGDLEPLAERIASLGWHLQFFINLTQTPNIVHDIARLPIPCVIDHFGHVHAEEGVQGPGFQTLLELARFDHVWFKLGGGYRVSKLPPPFEDVAPLAQALMAQAEDRCVFGTDWPHPNVKRMDDDGDLADALTLWVPNERQRHKVLAENPARLYQFD